MTAAAPRSVLPPRPERPAGEAPPAAGSDGRPLLLAELGLLALAVGTTAGLGRLFEGRGYLGALALPVAGTWTLAVLFRRAGLRLRSAAPLSLLLGALVLLWRFAPGDGAAGIPTVASARAAFEGVGDSFGSFGRLVAPVPAEGGFLLVAAAALWVLGLFADAAAVRLRAPVQAAVPYGAAFVGTTVLARDVGRVGAAVWFAVGLGLYAAGQRALAAGSVRWFADDRRRGVGAAAGAALAVAAVAVAGLAIAAPSLGGRTEGAVDLMDLGGAGGSRTVVSPLVGIRNLLGGSSEQVMFTVAADRPAYWRLTALDRFDAGKDLWVSDGTYRRTGAALAPAAADAALLDQVVTVANLGGPWLPAAYAPVRLTSGPRIGFDRATSSVLVRGGDGATPGTTYRVASTARELDAATLAGAPANPPPGTGDRYLATGLGDAQAARLAEAVRVVTGTTATDPERALALQNWFRETFEYDATVDYRKDPDPVGAFLDQRRGFCQQFASTFALMARAAGLPARVAIGFTPGDAATLSVTEGADEQTVGGFVVRGRHAHAWPEVHFDGIGWVAFEPTPDRGNPQATAYTGVEPAQAAAPSTTTTTTTAPTTTAPAGDPAAPTTTVAGPAGGAAQAGDRPAGAGRLVAVGVAVGAVGLLAGLGPRLARRLRRDRRRRQQLADPAEGPVAVAWSDALESLARLGVRRHPAETPVEFARRASRRVDRELAGTDADAPKVGPPLRTLAEFETRRRFAPSTGPGPSEVDAEMAAEAAVAVAERVVPLTRRRQPANR